MILRSMPKCIINTEIECANFGKINGCSRLIMPFDPCHSDNALETIKSNILMHVPTCYAAQFRRYAS